MPAANKLMLDFFRDVLVQGDDFVNTNVLLYGGDNDERGEGVENGDVEEQRERERSGEGLGRGASAA